MFELSTSLLVIAVLAASALDILVPWARNIQRARASGLPFVVVPYYSYNRVTAILFVRLILRPITQYVGEPSSTSWRTLPMGNWPWKHKHRPFALLGTDTFLTVAPGGIIFNTADADVINQIISRPIEFPKASHLYKSVDIYGENVVAAEGATWRYHRKLMSPAFSENNNQLVWKRSLHDGQAMLSQWLDQQAKSITTLAQDTMLLSLSVIGHAGFGQSIQWPGVKKDTNANTKPDQLSNGHQMTFTVALTTLLRNIYLVVIFPLWFLKSAPFKATRKSYLAYTEWRQYLHEIISSKREVIANSTNQSKTIPAVSTTNDILTQLLKENEQPQSNSPKQPTTLLNDSSILGNLFVLLLAGHETSANSIHFTLALLAMHPKIQTEVQAELDTIFTGRKPKEWLYERDLPALLNSKLNACVNEQLRLFAPTITIPKYTMSPQTLRVNGKQVTVPAKTITRICLPSVHQNPACWPSTSTSTSDSDSIENRLKDLASFNPSRWFTPSGSWYQPPKGTFMPFSDGARACLGRRFAQVEILAVLAVILSSYSVELAVDDFVSESVNDVTNEEEAEEEKMEKAWWKARERAERTMRDKMVVIITLQLGKGECIPVRIVPRGKDTFAGIV